MNEDLRTWFRQKWVRMDTKGKIKGPCGGKDDSEGKPKCLPAAKARSMSKQDRAAATRRKRREDPITNRPGTGNTPIMVKTEEYMIEGNEPTNPALWSKAKSLAKQKFDVYPSAYANGWAAKYYKSKGGGWKSVSEESVDEACWKGYKRVGMKKKGDRMVPNCVPEATDIIAKAKAKLAEADSKKYPREGFPEEGDYGYHPNPGLKPQESDKDEDMDVAYKKATEKEGRRPLNAKITEGEDMPWHEDPKNPTRKVGEKRKDQYGNTVKNVAKHLAKKAMKAYEETEIDEGVTNPEIKKAYANLLKTPGGSPERKSAIRRYKSLRQNAVKEAAELEEKWMVKKGTEVVSTHKTKDEADVKAMKHPLYKVYAKEETELEEAYGMWKVDFPKQHAGKAVAAGSVHVKAQNTAHAHKVAAKRVGVDHKVFKSKVTKSSILPEEVEGGVYSVHVKGDSKHHNTPEFKKHLKGWGGELHYASDKGAAYKFKKEYQATGFHHGVKSGFKHLDSEHDGRVNEELGKDNEWGRPELRKKFAAMTPGQEGLAADKIPTFDPRYDDVTTQHLGLHPVREGYLAEISAKGAEARAKFQARVHKVLNDPASIKRAKKTLAKKAKLEKEKEPAHLVMQLRKAVSVGSKVHFQDGSHHQIAPNHADVFMSKYNSAKSSIEKEALQKRAHKSHAEFMRTISEEVHENCGTPDCCQMCDTAEMGTHHVDSYEAHKGSGDQISPVISHDDDDIRFTDFNEEEIEKELEAEVLALSWDDIVDLYDEDEIEYVEHPELESEEELEEGITPAGRLKKKFNAMRTKSRRMMARNIAIKRVSTPEKIKSRSVRAARRMVYKRLLRNRDISTVSAAEKTRLEAQIKRMAPMVARLSVRVMPQVRKLEQSRIKNSRMRKKK